MWCFFAKILDLLWPSRVIERELERLRLQAAEAASAEARRQLEKRISTLEKKLRG